MEELDQHLFLLLNAGAHPAPGLLAAARFLASYLVGAVPLGMLGLWFLGRRPDRALALKALAGAGIALGANLLINLSWPHPRPFVLGLGHTFLAHAGDPSFPSDHAAVFFAFGAALLRGGRRGAGLLALALGCAAGWARVYLGVHFPLDILGALPVAFGANELAGLGWSRMRLGDRLQGGLESLTRFCLRGQFS